MEGEIIVQKKIWVYCSTKCGFYDDYRLTYVAVEKVKKRLYWFKCIKVEKLNDKPFNGGGCVDIRNSVPRIGERKLLRVHTLRWAVRNYTCAGRVIRWFNVHNPGRDEDYIQQTPTEFYPIIRNRDGSLTYPKIYESKY